MPQFTTIVPTFSRRSSIKSAIEEDESVKPLKQVNRTRSLTLPLQNPQKVGLRRAKQQTLDQLRSPLFSLPLELREQIYRFVLGGRCIAQDTSGVRIGDCSDPWPPWEKPGGERRGLRPWWWQPGRPSHILSMLMTCRQIYSEAINILYANNLFYFRNPITNWSFSTWRVLPKRLEQVRVLVLDETIGDPSIVFSNRKQWNRIWRTIAKMTRLKVLYFNVDTLYPKAWNCDLEKRLLGPLAAVTQPTDMCVILRWLVPVGLNPIEYPSHVRKSIWRIDDYNHPNDFYKAFPPSEMRNWIVGILRHLEQGETVGGIGSLSPIF